MTPHRDGVDDPLPLSSEALALREARFNRAGQPPSHGRRRANLLPSKLAQRNAFNFRPSFDAARIVDFTLEGSLMSRSLPFRFVSLFCALTAAAALAAETPCVGGMAGPYPCNKVSMLSHFALNQLGGGDGAVVWGWTDPLTGDEYALMAMSNGLSPVRITDPINPVYLGKLPLHAGAVESSWRDVKVYGNYAFIVSDQSGN